MAPGTAKVAHSMPTPSKAGPAEHEAQLSHSRLPSTISPLVPMSTSNETSSLSAIPVASTPALMSPPTKPLTAGESESGASG